MSNAKNILIAPLNWGLGHASRCIPLIRQHIEQGNRVIIASDGESLLLLQKEFPELESVELPSYGINYPRGRQLIWHLLKMTNRILQTINAENEVLEELMEKYKLDLVISDNRLGMYHKGVLSVYLTHQTNIQAGKFSKIANKVHHYYMKRFNEIWIPDYESDLSLAGELSDYSGGQIVRYIGPLSRFMCNKSIKEKDKLLILLTGPEPQRSLFQEIIYSQLSDVKKEVTIVLGIVEGNMTVDKKDNITVYNYMPAAELEKEMMESSLVISRSGYSTIMDLFALKKKAFFIPTPGQTEQEYLARFLEEKKICNYSYQESFRLIDVFAKSENYSGFMSID
ncbi:MAG: glycosyltransferase [Bacteroidota bacterium]